MSLLSLSQRVFLKHIRTTWGNKWDTQRRQLHLIANILCMLCYSTVIISHLRNGCLYINWGGARTHVYTEARHLSPPRAPPSRFNLGFFCRYCKDQNVITIYYKYTPLSLAGGVCDVNLFCFVQKRWTCAPDWGLLLLYMIYETEVTHCTRDWRPKVLNIC